MEPIVLVDVADHVATVTLNRPQQRNALNRALTHALWDAINECDANSDVHAIVLTGSDPAFCAGVDIKEVSGEVPSSDEPRAPGEGPERFPDGLYRFLPPIQKPIIGAINGVAVTGGLELALQCTFLVASERAAFADTHARLGIMPGGGMTVLLAQSIGLRKAIELSLTGNFISAADALNLGLVNHAVAHDDLLPFARKLASDIANNDQNAVRTLLGHYREIANASTLEEAHRIEGVLAESWADGTSHFAERGAAVMSRGREQTQ